MRLVSAAMQGKGYQISDMRVLERATWVKWLGKEESLYISNNTSIVTKLFACLVGKCV